MIEAEYYLEISKIYHNIKKEYKKNPSDTLMELLVRLNSILKYMDRLVGHKSDGGRGNYIKEL